GRAQWLRDLGSDRPDAIWFRPDLQAIAAVAIAARRAVHAGRLGYGLVHPAGEAPHDHAFGAGLGADRPELVPDLRRRAAGGSDKADLREAGGRARAAPAPRLRAGPAWSVTEGIG